MTSHTRRPNGKVARLPQNLRDIVNQMLLNGATYDAIINKLREHGVHLLRSNLTHWRQGGHQTWLKEQAWLKEMEGRLEFALDLIRKNEPGMFSRACSELASVRLFQALQNFHPKAQAHTLNADPMTFIRTTNAVCRLNSSIMQHQSIRDAKSTNPLPPSAPEQNSPPSNPPVQGLSSVITPSCT
jgi:hypothetical protein